MSLTPADLEVAPPVPVIRQRQPIDTAGRKHEDS
jgi:hypothetical protein